MIAVRVWFCNPSPQSAHKPSNTLFTELPVVLSGCLPCAHPQASSKLALMKLVGKTALVTGAAKRVGREIALGLAQHGANVVVHYNTSAADARDAVREIRTLGVDAIAVKANQASAREVRAAVGKAVKHFGDIHVLVASAAVYKKTPFDTLTEKDWDLHIDANLKGPFLFALEVGRRMRARNIDGKIITLLDISKAQGNHLLDRIEELLRERAKPKAIVRKKKPTFARPAPDTLREEIVGATDVLVEGLAD